MTPLVVPAAVAFLVALLLLGAVSARQLRGAPAFFVADRRGGTLLVAGSLLSTILGASATLGLAGRAYRDGLPAVWWLLVGSLGLLLLAFVFAGRIRSLGLYTLPEILEHQYGPAARRAAAGLIAVAWLGVIAAQFVAAAKLLGGVVGGDATGWLVASALVVMVYTWLGGQLSVLRTDAVQTLLLVAGLGLCLPLALAATGGWGAVAAALPPDLLRFPVNEAMGPRTVATWLLVVGLPYVAGPDMASRLFCARDEAAARRAAGLTAVALVGVALLLVGLGLVARAVAPGLADPEQALPALLTAALPPWAVALLTIALLSALLSSADTCLLTTATILAVDLTGSDDRESPAALRRARGLTLLVGALSLAVALRLGDIIGSLLFAYTLYTSGIALPLLLGFWRERLGLTTPGALAAMLAGGAVAVAGKLLAWPDASLWAMAASLGALFAASWVSGRRPS